MNKLIQIGLILLISSGQTISAITPTESLQITVDKLIVIAADKTSDEASKKKSLSEIIKLNVDFEAVSKRVVSKNWKKATAEQKQQFKEKFLIIVVNTYFTLLKEYSDEKVLFLKEQLKRKKYAIVDTQILSGNKKIPVRYRLLKSNDNWKIYDFVPEGISLINTYKNNYKTILKKNGMAGLLEEMNKKEQEKSEG